MTPHPVTVYRHRADLSLCYLRRVTIWQVDWLINPLECSLGIEDHVALDRNPGPGYNTLLLQLIPGYIFSACPYRQFQHTTRPFRQSDCTNTCVPSRKAVCTIFWWSLVWPGRGANLRPTAWEADKLTITLTRHNVTGGTRWWDEGGIAYLSVKIQIL